jgi:hypothetical protein
LPFLCFIGGGGVFAPTGGALVGFLKSPRGG